MRNRILLISRASEETHNLKYELRRQDHFSVNVASTPDHALRSLMNEQVNLVVFNTEAFTRKKMQITYDLREIGRKVPVLVLAESVLPDVLLSLRNAQGTVLLEKPYEPKDLFGLSEKLMGGEGCSQRIYRRYFTNQEGEFYKPHVRDLGVQMKVRNLSQGGAFIEFEERINLRTGDVLNLNIRLVEVRKSYKMPAKVVWVSASSPMGRTGCGVQFVR